MQAQRSPDHKGDMAFALGEQAVQPRGQLRAFILLCVHAQGDDMIPVRQARKDALALAAQHHFVLGVAGLGGLGLIGHLDHGYGHQPAQTLEVLGSRIGKKALAQLAYTDDGYGHGASSTRVNSVASTRTSRNSRSK